MQRLWADGDSAVAAVVDAENHSPGNDASDPGTTAPPRQLGGSAGVSVSESPTRQAKDSRQVSPRAGFAVEFKGPRYRLSGAGI